MTYSKRKRLEQLMAGEKADRPGVALWRHWPGDDQDAVELARSTVDWQELYDWDFVKVSPDANFCVDGWGATSRWVGNNEGNRQFLSHPIETEEDWGTIRPTDPHSGMLGAQIQCLEIVGQEFGGETPFIQTIFSPASQLKYLVGKNQGVGGDADAPRSGGEGVTSYHRDHYPFSGGDETDRCGWRLFCDAIGNTP